VPVLVLGDPAQLPPIQGGGFFTDAEPDSMLTEVHRQAQDDPIVRLSMQVRNGERLSVGEYGKTSVVKRDAFDPQRALETDQILVGRNASGAPIMRAYASGVALMIRCRFPATSSSVCATTGARGCSMAAYGMAPSGRRRGGRILKLRLIPTRALAGKGVKGIGAARVFTGRIEDFDWPNRKKSTSSITATC